MDQRFGSCRRTIVGALGMLLGVGLLGPFAPAAGAQQPPPDPQEERSPEAPPEETSFEELLAEEAEASVDEAEAAAAESTLPFVLRSQPLQGLPATMAALMMGSGPGGPVVSSVLALPLPLAAPPPPAETAPAETTPDDPADAAPPATSEAPEPPGDATSEKSLVALFVEVDGPSLLGPSPGETVELELFAYALGAGGGVAGFLSQRLSLDLEELGEQVFAGGVKLVGHLELAPGDYVLRVLVHERGSRRYGLRHVELSVPTAPALLMPLAPDLVAAWLLAVESPHGDFGRIDYEALLQNAGAPPPSALPVFAGDRVELDVLLLTDGLAAEPVSLEGRVLDVEENPAATLAVEVLGRRPTDIPGLDRLRVEVVLDELATGSYYLSLVGATGGAALSSPDLPFILLRTAQQATVWTEIERQRSGTAPPTELDLGTGGRRRSARAERVARAVERAYRSVLERLAGGDREGALADLMRIEAEVAGSDATDRPFEILAEAELGVLDLLIEADPEALLPVALLHADGYRLQREANAFGLATHDRTVAVAAAERFASHSTIDEASEYASDLLATIADELQRARVRSTARQMLESAVDLDDQNAFALLSLAVGLEKVADYAGAVEILERLVAVDPKSPEARLRLGINLLRLGRASDGRRVLQQLVGEDNPPWVLTIAYETLATERLSGNGRGNPTAVVDLLRQAVSRLPDQQRLSLQLAYALDRAGQPAEAARLIDRVGADGSGGQPSPRHQYNLWPEGAREEIDRQLFEAGMIRLPRLGAALQELPEVRGR